MDTHSHRIQQTDEVVGAQQVQQRQKGKPRWYVGSSPTPPTITEVQAEISTPAAEPPRPVAPIPNNATTQTDTVHPSRRPQSPTLCKFGTKCMNSQCCFSHPSPVAAAESGVVLSTDACEKGKDCQVKVFIKSHVSPVVNNPSTFISTYSLQHLADIITATEVQKPPITHSVHAPTTPSHPSTPCQFRAGCTRATCPYQHPEGRVLPTTFQRGLSTHAPTVNVAAPGVPSPPS